MVTKKDIDAFLSSKKLAIAGVSRSPKSFSREVCRELKKRGYEVLPVNPNTDEIEGDKCYRSIEDLPEDIKSLLILTPRHETDTVLRNAINQGFENIWVQQMSETAGTIKIADEYNKDIISKKCIFMFAEPVAGIHKFHRTITGIFGGLPK